MVLEALLLAAVGLVIGIFSGLLGIGGGTVIVPVLRVAFGFEAITSTATSLFTILFTSISGTAAHIRNRTCVPKLGIALGVGGAITSALGVYLGSISPSWAIMLVAAVIIMYSAYNMLKKALRAPDAPSAASGSAHRTPAVLASPSTVSGAPETLSADASPDGPSGPEEAFEYEMTAKRLLGGFGIGLIAGLCSGYVGVGGGFIMVPLMTAWLAVPMRYASGTSLIAIMILCIPGIVENIMLGNVDFLAGICLVVGSIPGAMIGAKFVKKVPERTLRFIFAGFLGIAAVMLVVKEFVL